MNKSCTNTLNVIFAYTVLLSVVCRSNENISTINDSASIESANLSIESSKEISEIDNGFPQKHEPKIKRVIDHLLATNAYFKNGEKNTPSPTTVNSCVTSKPPAYNISLETKSTLTSTSSSPRKVLKHIEPANTFTDKNGNRYDAVQSKLNKETDTNTSTNKNKIHIAKCCPHGKMVRRIKNETTHETRYNCKQSTEVLASNYPIHTVDKTKQINKTEKYFVDVFELVDTEAPTKMFQDNFNNFDLLLKNKYLNWYLLENGTLLITITGTPEWIYYEKDKYCADLLKNEKKKETESKLRFFTYHGESDDQTKNILKISMMLVSCVFFVLVLVVYGILPELRNLRGLVIMSYVGSQLTTFALLSTFDIITLVNKTDQKVTEIFTFAIYFFMLSSFLWMNILSFDTWYTSRLISIFHNSRRSRRRARYGLYCIYAWGVPLLVTVPLSHFDDILLENSWFRPDIAEYNFFSPQSRIIYMVLPISIVVLTNTIFFVLTFLNVWKLSRGNSTHLRSTVSAGQSSPAMISLWKRLKLYVKIFIIMGLTWVTEIFCQAYPDRLITIYILDLWNLFHGVFIFYIFVYKKKIWKMLVKRFTNAPPTSKWYIRSCTHQDETGDSGSSHTK